MVKGRYHGPRLRASAELRLPDPTFSPAHDAPPAYRPLSGAAVTALVLAIVLLVPALVGLWWVEVLPLVLVLLAWGGISSGARRGRGVAIAAAVVALTGGACAYTGARALLEAFETSTDRLMTALEAGKPDEVAPFVADPEQAPAVAATWIERYRAVRANAGAYAGRTTVANDLLGPLKGLFARPDDVEDLEDPTRPLPELGFAVWFQPAFPSARVFVAAVLVRPGDPTQGDAVADKMSADLKSALSDSAQPRYWDLRFFRERRAAGGS